MVWLVADFEILNYQNTLKFINMKTLNYKRVARYFGYILLVAILFTACNGFPRHIVCEGKNLMIVYKAQECNNAKYGKYVYAITDASGQSWTLYSFQKFSIGDTIRISNGN